MAIILKKDREIESRLEEEDAMPLLEEDDEMEYLVDGEILFTRRALSVQIKEDEK